MERKVIINIDVRSVVIISFDDTGMECGPRTLSPRGQGHNQLTIFFRKWGAISPLPPKKYKYFFCNFLFLNWEVMKM